MVVAIQHSFDYGDDDGGGDNGTVVRKAVWLSVVRNKPTKKCEFRQHKATIGWLVQLVGWSIAQLVQLCWLVRLVEQPNFQEMRACKPDMGAHCVVGDCVIVRTSHEDIPE